MPRKNKGTVYLVGAGPGDVGLLTLRGAEVLGAADVVVYDGLVSPEVLSLAPAGAEVLYGGKRAREGSPDQGALNALLIDKAREGKTVVRLKGGDPYIFGRGGEEAEALSDAGIAFEVVPGVSSVAAVPNYAGIPLTHRNLSSCILLVTGHEDAAKAAPALDWAQIARVPGTKVIMMATDRIGQISAVLVEKGMPASTPVAMIQWGTTGRQRSVEGTLATIGKVAAEAKLGPPTVVVVGDVVKLRSKLNWFEKRPLFGQQVVVTRARDQGGQLARKLRGLGAEVLEVPTIRLDHPTDHKAIVDALLEISSYDWLVFTSANGVTRFFEYFFKQFQDLRAIGGARIAAVGPGTANRLRELHLQVDLVPDEAIGARIAKAFAAFESVENLKICLLRAEVANRELPQALEEMGAIVDDIACYRTVAETADTSGAAGRLAQSGADWILFTSGSTVENFHTRFNLPALAARFPKLRLASIGPETTKALAALGVKPAIEAREHTMDGLLTALTAEVAKE